MPEKRLRTEVYVAREAFYYRGSTLVLAGQTVAAGHPMLRGRMNLFRPFVPTWPAPDAETPKADEPVEAEA